MTNTIQKKLVPVAGLLALLLLVGCASTKVTNREIIVTEKLPKPAHIWIYSFAVTANEVPDQSALSGAETTPQTDEEIVQAHLLGAQIAEELAENISALGLPAVHAATDTKPATNDIIIKGYLLSVDEGSATKRVALGFGSGGSKLEVAVEGFQMTETGLRKLGSGTVDSGSGKGPGGAVGLAVFLATANPIGLVVSGSSKIYGEASGSATIEGRAKATAKEISQELEPRFKKQGWIN